jgi:hypothetical protein
MIFCELTAFGEEIVVFSSSVLLKSHSYYSRGTWTSIFIAVLFTIAKLWK